MKTCRAPFGEGARVVTGGAGGREVEELVSVRRVRVFGSMPFRLDASTTESRETPVYIGRLLDSESRKRLKLIRTGGPRRKDEKLVRLDLIRTCLDFVSPRSSLFSVRTRDRRAE